MGEHFWPSIYPCIAAGMMLGFARGGLVNTALGALGGLGSSVAAFTLLGSFFSEEGLLQLAALIAVSLLGAECLIQGRRRFTG